MLFFVFVFLHERTTMKKTAAAAFLFLAALSETVAQYDQDYAREFKSFKVGVGGGYAVPSTGEGAGGGILLYLEPAYRATDQVLVGLRMEGALMVRGVRGVSKRDFSGDISSMVSYTISTQYYFNNNEVRPFVGAGVGLFNLAAVRFNTAVNDFGADKVGAETRFGFYPRAGVDLQHFNITLDYNVLPPTDVPGGGEVNNNYLGIRAGFSIGGGRTGRRF
jgi:outer membrane protein W